MAQQRPTFAVLGHVRALHHGADLPLGPPQQRTTLAILLLARGRVVSTDELWAALWGYDAPRAAAHGLEAAACRLSWSVRYYLDWTGHWRDLAHVNTIALAAAERTGDRIARAYALRGLARLESAGEPYSRGTALEVLGHACHHLGRYDEAKATLRETRAAVTGFLAEPDGEDWYTRASAMPHKTVAVAEELGLGAYILETG